MGKQAQLINKVALITGAISGIGLGIAERFASEGAIIILVDRDHKGGKIVVAHLQNQGRKAHFIQTDLADPQEHPWTKREGVSILDKLSKPVLP